MTSHLDENESIRNYRLVEARKNKKFQQKDIAEQVGISRLTYLNYESMRYKPNQSVKNKIAQVLEKPLEYLFPKNIESYYEYNKTSEDIYDNHRRINLQQRINPHNINSDKLAKQSSLRKITKKLLETLNHKEKEVIKLRFGIDNENAHTLEKIGKIYGVTRERIRQIESRAIERLRRPTKLEFLKEVFSTYR